jgi:CheY-like chemotaxis protein
VTEKDPLVRRWLGSQAEELGVQLVFARSRDEALRAISEESPDCVVLDASTSADEDEAPLWTELRSAPATRHIPVLLYSSCRRWQRVAELAAADVDGVIARPFTPELLLRAAARARNARRAAQA